jgi:hypothetical protein
MAARTRTATEIVQGNLWMDAELTTAERPDYDSDRFAYVADKLAVALRDMQIAYAEALGFNAALDAHLRLAMKHAQSAFDLACGEVS